MEEEDVVLRDVSTEDLPIFFEHQRGPDAKAMAAYPARGPGRVHGDLGEDLG